MLEECALREDGEQCKTKFRRGFTFSGRSTRAGEKRRSQNAVILPPISRSSY